MNVMAEIEAQEEINTAGDYQFADGDLSRFQQEFAVPKQDMNIEEEPDDFQDVDESGNNGGEQPAISAAKAARSTARFLAPIVDQGAAFGLSLISKNELESHRADKESLKELERLIAEYTKESGGDIPIWIQLVICLVTMYGFQVPKALADRKLNNERLELEKERKALTEIRQNYENKIIELNENKEPNNGTKNN